MLADQSTTSCCICHTKLWLHSLIPRPSPSFPSLVVRLSGDHTASGRKLGEGLGTRLMATSEALYLGVIGTLICDTVPLMSSLVWTQCFRHHIIQTVKISDSNSSLLLQLKPYSKNKTPQTAYLLLRRFISLTLLDLGDY